MTLAFGYVHASTPDLTVGVAFSKETEVMDWAAHKVILENLISARHKKH
jgi:hypothetical protein